MSGPSPSAADLERVIVLLGVPVDPVLVRKDHPEPRQRAELLARIAAWATRSLAEAEEHAVLGGDDSAALHWSADLDVASAPPESGGRLLDPQIDRLTWVRHTIPRLRGPHRDPVAEAATAALSAVVALLRSWRPGPDESADGADPLLGDALLGLAAAADHLTRTLRQHRPGPS
jgi:hypothetical protein